MEKKYISDILNYEEHIKPYDMIEIVAGVGSGKNTWIENEIVKNGRVLLITSRKAKVEETSQRSGIITHIDLELLDNSLFDLLSKEEKKRASTCVCNSWTIEHYIKNKYKADDKTTHLWRYFDVIVIDEAHSLATDATYCDAPFHLLTFINEVKKHKTTKIIIMTATPKPIKALIEETSLYKKYDLRGKCKNVAPKNICIETKDTALNEILAQFLFYNSGTKTHIIYFVNRIDAIKQLIESLTQRGVPEDVIAISYSQTKKDNLFSDVIIRNKNLVEKTLREKEDLPHEIFIFISTTRNKEGINIKNDEYSWYLYTESHYEDEFVQMCGRVRSGLNKFSVIYDANQHQRVFCYDEPKYLISKNGVECATKSLNEWIQKQEWYNTTMIPSYNSIRYAIEEIEKEFEFIRYDIFKAKFIPYKGRIQGCRRYAQETTKFEENIDTVLGLDGKYHSVPYNHPLFISGGAERDIKKIFYKTKDLYNAQIIRNTLASHFEKQGYFASACITKDIEQNLLDFIHKLDVRQQNGKPYSSLGKALSPYGFGLQSAHRRNAPKIIVDLQKEL